jgi:hypothetical protein
MYLLAVKDLHYLISTGADTGENESDLLAAPRVDGVDGLDTSLKTWRI